VIFSAGSSGHPGQALPGSVQYVKERATLLSTRTVSVQRGACAQVD